MQFEEKYEDVLQNLEAPIVEAYRETPALLDYNVMRALQAAIDEYKAEQRQRAPKPVGLDARDKVVYEGVRQVCEWRLGRVPAKPEKPSETPPPTSIEEMILCLKRIHASVEFWNKQQGRQGYLNYVSNFM